MVRIKGAGPSTACRTCKRRRVKCDATQPTCTRCSRGGFQCEGYTRDFRFVDEAAKTEKHVQKSDKLSSKPSPSSSLDFQSPLFSRHTSSDTSWSSIILSPQTPKTGPIVENIYVSYTLSNLLKGAPVQLPWLHTILEETSASAKSGLIALGAVYFGQQKRYSTAITQGFTQYGKALQHLNNELQEQPTSSFSLSVLKSAMLLFLFELTARSPNSGWLQHAGGIGRLVELLGPYNHQNPVALHLLESNRFIVASQSLVLQKRCFLERPEWKTIPWALNPDSKTLRLRLHDEFCDLPGLLEDLKLLKKEGGENGKKFKDIKRLEGKLNSHLRSLINWKAEWDSENPDSSWEVDSQDPDPIWPRVFHFSGPIAASKIIIYQIILLFNLRILSRVNQLQSHTWNPSYPGGIASFGDPFSLDNLPTPLDIATDICRSVEYHSSDGVSSDGSIYLLFPLRVAYQVFEEGGREKIWVEENMKRIFEGNSFGLGQVIFENKDMYNF